MRFATTFRSQTTMAHTFRFVRVIFDQRLVEFACVDSIKDNQYNEFDCE